MRATYTFSGTWEIAAPVAAVHALLVDLEHYPDWWPQVVAIASLGPDDARVLCRSALPYTLDLALHAVNRSDSLLEARSPATWRGRCGSRWRRPRTARDSISPRRSPSRGRLASRDTSPARCSAGITTG